MEVEVEGEEVGRGLLHHHHLCWVLKGQGEVGHPCCAVGETVAREGAGCVGGAGHEGRAEVRRTEIVESVLEAAAVEGRLCLSEGVGAARLHVLGAVGTAGSLAVTGLG